MSDEKRQTHIAGIYRTLIQVMRKDLKVDKKIDDNFPDIGLRDINVKK